MKKLLLLLFVFFSTSSVALEKKNIMEVSLTEIISETQAQPENAQDSHFTLVWWVPLEYWNSVFSRDTNSTDSAKTEMLEILKNYTVFAVVQAEVSMMGSFDFYDKVEVIKNLKISYIEDKKEAISLSPEDNVSDDMQLLMAQIGPVLKAAMGNMGANFHFLIYSDVNDEGDRLVDPYKAGEISVSLANREGQDLEVGFQTPLNSLFLPRVCPNGENAHVSWHYCPWSGKKI